MADQINKASQKKKKQKRFIAVDVWRSHFGIVSVRAIYDIYADKFQVEQHNMQKHSLSKCIDALRKLEDPDYTPPQDQSSFD